MDSLSRFTPHRDAQNNLVLLGSGGFGVVLKAHDNERGETVALKLIFCSRAQAARRSRDSGLNCMEETAKRERDLTGRVQHNNIVRLYQYTEISGNHPAIFSLLQDISIALRQRSDQMLPEYFTSHPTQRPALHAVYSLAYEFVDGNELFDWLLDVRTGRPNEVQPLFVQLASAVATLHRSGVAHLDIKLENVLLSSDHTQIKLVDFGLAEMLPHATALFGARGSSSYQAPEMHVEGRTFDAFSADIFALGFTLLSLTTGMFAWNSTQRNDAHFAMFRRLNHSTESFTEAWRPPVPSDVAPLIDKMLHPNPSHRPTASEVLLHPWLRGWITPEDEAAALADVQCAPVDVAEDSDDTMDLDDTEPVYRSMCLGEVELPPLQPTRLLAVGPKAWYAGNAVGSIEDERKLQAGKTTQVAPTNVGIGVVMGVAAVVVIAAVQLARARR